MHTGHRQRLKSRFIKDGLDSFEPHNALELLLFYALPQQDTNLLAHRLIEYFGSFSAVLDASVNDLTAVPGVGEHTAVLLSMIPQLGRMYLNDKVNDTCHITDTESAGRYMLPKFYGISHEVVYMACLDNRGKILACERISEGTINATHVTIRQMVDLAVRVRAATVILAHNHPQGFALPSQADIQTTLKIQSTLENIGITLQDHLIIAQDDFVSLADSGMLQQK